MTLNSLWQGLCQQGKPFFLKKKKNQGFKAVGNQILFWRHCLVLKATNTTIASKATWTAYDSKVPRVGAQVGRRHRAGMEHAVPPHCPPGHCPHQSLLGSGNISTEHRPVISSAHSSRMTRGASSHWTGTHTGTHRHRIKAQTDWFLLFKFPCLSMLVALKNRAPPIFFF